MSDKNEWIQHFQEKASLVQAVVSSVKQMEDVLKYAVDLTVQQHGKTIAAPGLAEDHLQTLEVMSRQAGLMFLHEPLRNHLNDIHTGLTGADWGIAETGSLVLDSTSEDLRIATMLSETHIAWVPASRIQPNAESLSACMTEKMQTPPGYLSFITGASRTADIERVLAIGVHGPQALHILIMEDSPS